MRGTEVLQRGRIAGAGCGPRAVQGLEADPSSSGLGTAATPEPGTGEPEWTPTGLGFPGMFGRKEGSRDS